LFDTSLFVELQRMPELLCGFPRRPGEGPTLYPVACAPQSWSAAASFSLIQSLLGLSIDAPRREIRFVRSALPESLERVQIRHLQVGDASVDLLVERLPSDVGVELIRRDGDVQIITLK
jgi:glycogen debranching enzyme